MNDQDKEYIKGKLEDYLQNKGIDTRKAFKCLTHNPDNNPSMTFKDNNRVKCWSVCDKSYDIFELIAIENHTDFKGACKIAEDLYLTGNQSLKQKVQNPKITEQKEETDQTTYFKKCHSMVKETDYFFKRGLSQKTIERFNLGYDPEFKTKDDKDQYVKWQAVIIPTSKESYLARNTDLNAKEDTKRKRGKVHFLNIKVLQSGKPVFITEGELDALSIIEAGAEAIALGSTANVNKFIQLCKDTLNIKVLCLALDNDQAGKEATGKLKVELKALNIPFLQANVLWTQKDANQALTEDRQGFINGVQGLIERINANLWETIEDMKPEEEKAQEQTDKEAYLQGNSAFYAIQPMIDGIKASMDTLYIPTRFKRLDTYLDGGLYEGLYIIGAISSLGKTSWILQIADQIATKGQDVLFFSLEMSKYELMAKSISRLTFLNAKGNTNLAKTARGITTGRRYMNYEDPEAGEIKGYSIDEVQHIKQAFTDYKDKYSRNVFIFEGVGDIGVKEVRVAVGKHINFTGNKPIVIIDYLQILSPYEIKATDKQNTDKAVLELKRLSRDHKTPVIAISSLNRMSYKDPITFEAFKESGAIEYSSDVLIGMQLKGLEDDSGKKDANFKVDQAKGKEPREIEIKVLKNRNGKTGGKLDFKYYQLFNCFME